MNVGEEIARLRKEKGYSLRRLEQECGIMNTYLTRIEHGQFIPKVDTLERILAPLGAVLKIEKAAE